jgi:hypothetical protein
VPPPGQFQADPHLPPPPGQFQAEPHTPSPLFVVPPPGQFQADPHVPPPPGQFQAEPQVADASAIPKGGLSVPILKPSFFFIVKKEKSPQARDEKKRFKKNLRVSLPLMTLLLFLIDKGVVVSSWTLILSFWFNPSFPEREGTTLSPLQPLSYQGILCFFI